MRTMQDIVRNAAASDVIQQMSTEKKRKSVFSDMASLPDDQLDLMAQINEIPQRHWHIFRALMRQQECEFTRRLKTFEDQLETGDVILMTGASIKSKLLVKSQIPFYWQAKSSHVVLVHADFICIDAMPDSGVSNRLISNALQDIESDWRVIRFNKIDSKHREAMQQRCAFYIAQPYKISPSKKPAKDFSYCSELVRKVYQDCNVEGCQIPKNQLLIKPCDFDRIADEQKIWTDVTQKVRPYIEFVKEHEALTKTMSNAFIHGLLLNRSRYEDRRTLIRAIRAAEKKGEISPEKATESIKEINAAEKNLNFAFWDFH
jgi:hypothetical protein